jgi:hypothetical protein
MENLFVDCYYFVITGNDLATLCLVQHLNHFFKFTHNLLMFTLPKDNSSSTAGSFFFTTKPVDYSECKI